MKTHHAIGRCFFAIALITSGLLQLVRQDFVRLVPKSSAMLPWPHFLASASGGVLIALGLAILTERKRREAALGIAVLFFAVGLLYLPEILSNPGAGFMWTNPCKTLALLGGALLVAAQPIAGESSVTSDGSGRVEAARRLCAGFLGVFLVVCGVQHFIYADFVVQLVPGWIPGQRFWAYFTGCALIAGGVGVNLRPVARLAAGLSGVMVFLWVILLHVPRAIASWPDPGEIAGIFEALALSGTALLLVSRVTRNDLVDPVGPAPANGRKPGGEFPWS